MGSGADIVVISPGEARVHLVVEVKLAAAPPGEGIRQLKQYMFGMGASVGLLVTPAAIAILRDSFQGGSEESVQVVKTIPTTDVPELARFALGHSTDPLAFEDAVQGWLVQLRHRLVEGHARGVDPLLAEHLMPALTAGEIRAGGPRHASRAAG